MAKYEIDINLRAKKLREREAEVKAQVADVAKLRQIKDQESKQNINLQKNLSALTESIEELTKQVKEIVKQRGGLGPPSLGAIGQMPYRGPGGFALRSSIFGLGVILSAFGFLTKKIAEFGQRAIDFRLQQRQTAGIAGVQVGAGNYFLGAEFAQYLKERRLAAGRFEVGKRGEYAKARQAQLFEFREGQAPVARTITHFGTEVELARTFGTSEFARTTGLLDVFTRGAGSAAIAEIVGRTMEKRGGTVETFGTELKAFLTTLTAELEEAVKEGIDGSRFAKERAEELREFKRFGRFGTIREIEPIIRSLVGIQEGLGKGQTSIETQLMYRAGINLLTEQGRRGEEIRQRLVQEGVITTESAEQLRRGEAIAPEQLRFAVQFLSTEKAKELRDKFQEQVFDIIMGGINLRKFNKADLQARFFTAFQEVFSGLGITPQRAMTLFRRQYAQRTGEVPKGEAVKPEEVPVELVRERIKASGYDAMAEVGLGVAIETRRESMLVNEAARASMRYVATVNESLYKLVSTITTNNAAMSSLTTAIDALSSGITVATTKIAQGVNSMLELFEAKKKSFREKLIDMIKYEVLGIERGGIIDRLVGAKKVGP